MDDKRRQGLSAKPFQPKQMVISSTNEQIQNTPLLLLIVGYRAFLIQITMAIFSFIDNEKKDFLRYEDGSIIMISTDTWEGAESWLLSKGRQYGWTNTGVKYWNWSEEFPD